MEIIRYEFILDAVRKFDRQAAADAVAQHGAAVSAGEGIVLDAVTTFVETRDATLDGLIDGNIDRPFELGKAIVAGAGTHITGEFVGRLRGREQYGAAGRVFPEQSTLRTFEHLNRL